MFLPGVGGGGREGVVFVSFYNSFSYLSCSITVSGHIQFSSVAQSGPTLL